MNLRLLAWEITRRCPLNCRHCRAAATDSPQSGELSTAEALAVIASLARLPTRPAVIFTGGEPMYRADLADLIQATSASRLRPLLAPCGTLVTERKMATFKAAGLAACSFSLDGATPERHDAFRRVPGAWKAVHNALEVCRRLAIPFQINVTLSRLNLPDLERFPDLAASLGATRLDLFFLVPAGRGKELADLALDPRETLHALRRIETLRSHSPIPLKVTCAPQSAAIWSGGGYGCLAARGFLFLSHTGQLQPCGFLNLSGANVRDHALDLPAAFAASPALLRLADRATLKAPCAQCPHRDSCGGCRARAYAIASDPFAGDPSCPIRNR